jgi:cholesterol oxidase
MSSAKISRRTFLGAAALGAGSLGAAACGRTGPRESKDDTPHYDAIVIGSGYGGGVTALRLGEAGISTLILEKGRLWERPDPDGMRFSKMLPPDNRAGWFDSIPPSLITSFGGFSIEDVVAHSKSTEPVQAGICERIDLGAHSVFRGIGVGGGSLINAGIAAIPTPAQVSAAFPDIDPGEFLGVYTERAKSTLGISYRDMDWFEQTPCFQYARVGRKYAQAAGYGVDYNGSSYSFDYLKREAAGEVPRSALAFEQQFGNNYGRTGSVDATYISAALKTGKVTLKPLTEVTDIERDQRGRWLVRTSEIDRLGTQVATGEITCARLFLTAGVLGTVKLLLRAKQTGALPDLPEEIGQGYGNNGDVMVAHALADEDPAGTEQSLMGMINLDGRDDPENPVYASIFSIPLPVETHALGYYVMVRTGDRAAITYDAASNAIKIDWPQQFTDNQINRALRVFDKVTQANNVTYRDDLFKGNTFAPHTVHPMGGCVRGVATDAVGRVHGYDNLYVNDASLLPGYLGCNPYMTITALAERNIEAILRR